MRRLARLPCLLLVTACGAPPTPPVAAPAPVPIVSAPTADPAGPAVDSRNLGHLPRGCAAVAAVDPARLDELLRVTARRFLPHQTAKVEELLGVSAGTLAHAGLTSSIGVDPSRPILVGVAALDPTGREVLGHGTSAVDRTAMHPWESVDGLSKTIAKAFSARHPAPAHIRVTVPSTDTARLLTAIHELLQLRRYQRVATPGALESMHARRERVVALSLGPGVVIVDVFAFQGLVPSPRMMTEAVLHSWESLLAPTGEQAPSLDGRAARLSYAPLLVAELAGLERLSREQDLIAIERDGQPDLRMTRAAQDALRLRSLAGGSRPSFERVELSLSLDQGFPRFDLSAKLGAGIAADAVSACSPSVSVDFPGALSRFDISASCMKAVRVPGDTVGQGSSLVQNTMFDDVARSGALAWPVALGSLPFALTRIPLQWYAGVGARAMQRMDRFGWSNPSFGAPDVFWGLLPAGATGDTVACAAEESPVGCKGNRRLVPGRTQQLANRAFARLVPLGGRLVLLASRDKAALEAMVPTLTAAAVPPLRAAVSEGTLQRTFTGIGAQAESIRYVGHASLTADRLEVTFHASR